MRSLHLFAGAGGGLLADLGVDMNVAALLDRHGAVVANAVYDDCDIGIVAGLTWRLHRSKRTIYAQAFYREGGRHVQRFMHRLILGATAGQIVDHINGNGLDNRRANLRLVNKQQNGMNRGLAANSTSGVTGVCQRGTKWQASIRIGGRLMHLGVFISRSDAISARRAAEIDYFGEYARGG